MSRPHHALPSRLALSWSGPADRAFGVNHGRNDDHAVVLGCWRAIDRAEHNSRDPAMIESISAITLATHDMVRATQFYRALGFELLRGGDDAAFTSFRAGASYLNLIAQPAVRRWSWWGRVIFYVPDVDACYANAVVEGYTPDTAPRDAEWGERFFHITDPDGHELSFARPFVA